MDEPRQVRFRDWVRAELRVRRISARQLASRAGLDPSTVSRIAAGARSPTLGTAVKIARALRAIEDEAGITAHLEGFEADRLDPVQRVEYALRADPELDEPSVRRIMAAYISVRQTGHLPPDGRVPAPA